jgi:hypothetical protein
MPSTVDNLALLKILLHSAKYPASAINGILLGTAGLGDDKDPLVHVTDAIPLFHSFLTLAPALETALLQVGAQKLMQGCSLGCCATANQGAGMRQVDAYCQGQADLQVVGYYHANEGLKDTELKPFARRIADRIQQRCPQAVVLLVRTRLVFPRQQPSCLGSAKHAPQNAGRRGLAACAGGQHSAGSFCEPAKHRGPAGAAIFPCHTCVPSHSSMNCPQGVRPGSGQ